VDHIRQRLTISERRACRAIDQPRSTQRYVAREAGDEKELVKRMKALSALHPRYGYRRIWALLRAEKFEVNKKRVRRLWRREGLKVPRKQRKKRRLGHGGNSCTRRRAERMNQVWSYDFVLDQTADGRRLKLLTVVDEFTRECLAIEVERGIKAEEVVDTLAYLVELRGRPEFVRSDNGPEFIALAVRSWLKVNGCDTGYIEPGSPWENAYVESFNGKLEDECLDREEFATLKEAKVLVEDWRLHYNTRRPHSSLEYQTPAAFAASCAAAPLASLGEQRHTKKKRHQLS
jgi:transposase InsO family protein